MSTTRAQATKEVLMRRFHRIQTEVTLRKEVYLLVKKLVSLSVTYIL